MIQKILCPDVILIKKKNINLDKLLQQPNRKTNKRVKYLSKDKEPKPTRPTSELNKRPQNPPIRGTRESDVF